MDLVPKLKADPNLNPITLTLISGDLNVNRYGMDNPECQGQKGDITRTRHTHTLTLTLTLTLP